MDASNILAGLAVVVTLIGLVLSRWTAWVDRGDNNEIELRDDLIADRTAMRDELNDAKQELRDAKEEIRELKAQRREDARRFREERDSIQQALLACLQRDQVTQAELQTVRHQMAELLEGFNDRG